MTIGRRRHRSAATIGGAAFLALVAASAVAGTVTESSGIRWLDYEQAIEQARVTGKPLLINFTADWCKYCRMMKAETYTDPEVIAYLREHYVVALVDTEERPGIAQQYFVRGLPTIWFLTSEGEPLTNLPGYVDAPMFRQMLAYLAEEAYRTQTFAEYLGIAAPPDDGTSDGKAPGRSAPGGSGPGGSGPGGSGPGGSAPGGSMPGGSAPGGSAPGGSAPGGSAPGGSMPGGSAPGGSVPGGSVPGRDGGD
ncbi:MAG: thioredoxin family protein [Candidatus Krumholzibacteriia bacterium]